MELLLKLSPSVSFKIWGGKNLAKIKNIESAQRVGETWEISSHPSGPSKLQVNKTCLSELVNLSYLLKYIDTSDNLSVQAHPDDEFAQEHENEKGKTECWLILDAQPGAGVYLGFKSGVTKKEFRTALGAGMRVDGFLNFYEARPGDFFVVPAGAVHAIGAGVTLAEAQQNSGVTYRVWDWNRVGDDGNPRELHIEKAMEVMRFDEAFNRQLGRLIKRDVWGRKGTHLLFRHPEFRVDLISMSQGDKQEVRVKPKEGFTLLKGRAEIDGEIYKAFDSSISTGEGLVPIRALEDCALLSVQDLGLQEHEAAREE